MDEKIRRLRYWLVAAPSGGRVRERRLLPSVQLDHVTIDEAQSRNARLEQECGQGRFAIELHLFDVSPDSIDVSP